MTSSGRPVSLFWDLSNITWSARPIAIDREGPALGQSIRLNFRNILDLACAHRPIRSGVVATSHNGGTGQEAVWRSLQDMGLEIEVFDRGAASGKEQAVDQALQVHMLRAALDHEPGVAVLMTGDGAGATAGRGFFADLKRMHARGWQVEVMAWESSCNRYLKEWAQENGTFIALETFYDSVTFVPYTRFSRPLPHTLRPPVRPHTLRAIFHSARGIETRQFATEGELQTWADRNGFTRGAPAPGRPTYEVTRLDDIPKKAQRPQSAQPDNAITLALRTALEQSLAKEASDDHTHHDRPRG